MVLSGLAVTKVFPRFFTTFPARVHGLVQLWCAIADESRVATKVTRHSPRERAGQ